MKRKETSKLKSKGIKSYIPNDYHAHSYYKFNRNYVASHYADINRVSVICGSRRAMRMFSDENPNVRLWIYLIRYMQKRVGDKMDDVFHDFCSLGWKSTKAMYYYWSGFTNPKRGSRYYMDEEGYMRINPYHPLKGNTRKNYDWDYFDDLDEAEEGDDNEKYLLKYARKPSSEKRLVRRKRGHHR